MKFPDKVLQKIISEYTRESGVRELDRLLAGMMRNAAKQVAMEGAVSPKMEAEDVERVLGKPRFINDIYQKGHPPGMAVGLAWTAAGGEILFIETALSKSKGGSLTLTGNLGNVMKESASTALSYLKAHAADYGIAPERFEDTAIHIHVPEGAVPKDGPSAGITMLTALTSAFTGRTVKPFVAMTGEITLRGQVLPVGGVKEKALAARRAGIKDIILSRQNEKDVEEINPGHVRGLRFHFVEAMDEVLQLALAKR
jgi:ATP-dependent Lon protease